MPGKHKQTYKTNWMQVKKKKSSNSFEEAISSCKGQERTAWSKKFIIRKHRHRNSMTEKWWNVSSFEDKTQSIQYKCHVKLDFFFFFWGLSIKACQRRTHRCQGAWLTQWDCKLDLHGMQQFKGTKMTSAVLGNRELSSCLVFRAAVLLAIVSRRRGG